MSVAEDSKLSGEDESMSASVLHTALDELEEHLGAAEDLLRDGDEAGALEHIGDAEALLATREGWQAVDGVRRHAGRHAVLVRKSATLLACRRPRDAMAAADDAWKLSAAAAAAPATSSPKDPNATAAAAAPPVPKTARAKFMRFPSKSSPTDARYKS
mmetsp:Transcript_21990/g.71167  ORF Transcript_21990/g.71167 Transcript_21990/m.71167 type:complete len:158 (+) Transcript_21990:74-547(+)